MSLPTTVSKEQEYHALGLMSGSSLDGLDLAFCRFIVDNQEITDWQLIVGETLPFSEKWITRLRNLPQQNALTFAQTNVYFGHYLGELVKEFCIKNKVKPDFIASHGHTIFHHPEQRVTVQIGDGAALAAFTGYPVICDFRSQDVAINGEGAPVAPIADQLLLKGYDFYLNLGGIANISADINGEYIAFDIGGANQILNILANEAGLEYDDEGRLAASGTVHEELLNSVNGLPFFQQNYPKSLDNQWVMKNIAPAYVLNQDIPLEDRLHTACLQLAEQINLSIQQIIRRENLAKANYKMLVTGGGAFNKFLMDCIQKACPSIEVVIPDTPLIAFKEAILMALMGTLRVVNRANCLKSVTGAKRDTIGGAIYQGWKKQI